MEIICEIAVLNCKCLKDHLIIQGLKNLSRSKDRGTQAFYCFLLAVWIFLSAVPFSDFLQFKIMGKFHLRSQFFPSWMLTQLIPSMYNFNNEMWMSDHRFSKDVELTHAFPSEIGHAWVNHYPLRTIFFNLRRKGLLFQQKIFYVYLKSSYRDTSLYSVYRLIPEGGEMKLELMEND